MSGGSNVNNFNIMNSVHSVQVFFQRGATSTSEGIFGWPSF